MLSVIEQYIAKMTEDDKLFFREIGQRITKLRKEMHLTQVKLAEFLGISQQYMQAFESGHRKVAASMLPRLAQLFGITVDELVGMKGEVVKRGPTPKLQKQIEQIALLPKAKQKFVSEMLDTVIQQ